MRDKRLIAEHRGGLLTKDNHHKLIRWARECSEHVLSLIDENIDKRLVHALHVAKEWENENVTVGVVLHKVVPLPPLQKVVPPLVGYQLQVDLDNTGRMKIAIICQAQRFL